MSDQLPAPTGPPVTPAKKDRQPGGFGRGFGMGMGLAIGAGVIAVILAIVSTVGFVISMAALGSAVSSGTGTGTEPVRDTVWGKEGAAHTVVAIPVSGLILGSSASDSSGLFGGATYGYDVAADIDALDADDADALILEMDTPGGTIYGSKAIYDAVERYQERTKKPVVAYVRGMSASGGMYAMVGVDEVILDHGTMVGSIGVIYGPFAQYNGVTGTTGSLLTEGVQTEGGITEEYITGGKGKDFGNPYREMTPEERANAQAWVNAEYEAFVTHVATNREIAPDRIRNEFGAYIFGPQGAVANGLADSEMGQDEAYRHVAELAEVDPDDTRVVTELPTAGFLTGLLGQAPAGQGQAGPAEAARKELAASSFCTGGAGVLALYGSPASYCG